MQKKGDLAAAEPLYREALEARREILGNRHPSTLGSINNLGALLQDKGDLAAAEPLYREALWRGCATPLAFGIRSRSAPRGASEPAAEKAKMGDLAAAESETLLPEPN